jgi:hypothetical protein
MADPFFEFEWHVAKDYKWVDWLDRDGQPVLPEELDLQVPDTMTQYAVQEGKETGPVLTPQEGQSRVFHPMDRRNAVLFRRFAGIDHNDTSEILNFAREYGLLGAPRQSQTSRRVDGSLHWAEGESQLAWACEIAQMRRAIWLWEHPKSAERDQEEWGWLFDSHLQRVEGRMRFGPGITAQLRIAPVTLLAAMWLQLALAVAGNKEFVKCKFCERQIEISTADSGFRTNRQFCSDSCKTKDYRKRKRTALKMAKRGMSVSTIVKQLDTRTATVRRWLTDANRQ